MTEKLDAEVSEYNAFVATVSLESVEQTRCSAERLLAGTAEEVETSLEGQVGVGDGKLLYRFAVKADLKTSTGEVAGHLELDLAAAFSYEGQEPQETVVQRFSDNAVMLVAYPYIREGLQSLATRIGFTGVTLPLTKPD